MKDYISHLIECQCILPVYNKVEKPVYHNFVVFSLIEEGTLEEKYVECNNCGIIHKIKDFNKSDFISDTTNYKNLVVNKEDLSYNMPAKYLEFLTSKKIEEIYIWEKINYLLDNNIEEEVIFNRSKVDNFIICEIIQVIDKDNFKLKREKFQRDILS